MRIEGTLYQRENEPPSVYALFHLGSIYDYLEKMDDFRVTPSTAPRG